MNGFLRKIATKQLGMPLEEYERQTYGLSLEEIEEMLSERAKTADKEVPYIKPIMQSIINDQAMAAKCHKEWLPPLVRYFPNIYSQSISLSVFSPSIHQGGTAIQGN